MDLKHCVDCLVGKQNVLPFTPSLAQEAGSYSERGLHMLREKDFLPELKGNNASETLC